MKITRIIIILSFFFFQHVYAEKKNCNNIDKLSKDYAKCIAELAKEKGKEVKQKVKDKGNEVKEKVATTENKKKFSKFKSTLKKFKDSKTGAEFLKKE